VEDGEPGISSRSTFRVQLSNHCADIRFEQAGADNHENEAKVKRQHAGNPQHEFPRRDEQATVPNTSTSPYEPVCNPSTRQSSKVNPGGVEAGDGGGNFVG